MCAAVSPLSMRTVLTLVFISFTVAAVSVAKLQHADCLDDASYDTPLKAHLHAGWSKSSCRRPSARFSSSGDGSRPLCLGTGVLMNVFLGVIRSVFKRSVACPGQCLRQHVYGVTITCSSGFYIRRNICEVLFQVQSGRPEMLLLGVAHLVSSFSPKVVHEFALGALRMSAIVCLSWTCLFCVSMVSRSLAPIVCIYSCSVGAWKALDPMKSANLVVNAVTGAISLKCLTAHTS